MIFYVDRELSVPLGVQLRGLIEYGIAYGELAAGERLPSVRELADQIGIAPMTVSQVYRELKEAGLIETRAGSGTFVADSSRAKQGASVDTASLYRRIDRLIEDGLVLGLKASELAALFNSRVFHRARTRRRARVVMLGLFKQATASYARVIAAHLKGLAAVEPATIESIRNDSELRDDVASADLVITFANRHREVEALLPRTPVVAISFIPSEETRLALASLSPLASIAVVSRFPEFLPIMKTGVQRFAPHVTRVAATALEAPDLDAAIAEAGVVIYSSGAESVLDRLASEATAIEYRHIPDPSEIERVIVPQLRKEDPADVSLEKEAS